MFIDNAELLARVGVALTMIGSVWTLAMWLSKQFSQLRALVFQECKSLRETFTDKLEYHEQHDDKRFGAITEALWDLRLRNAARDGRPHSHRHHHNHDKEDQWYEEQRSLINSQTNEK